MGDPIELGPALVAALDAEDMLGAITGLPRQLTVGYAVARARLAQGSGEAGAAAPAARPTGLAICGMGGSAIGGDLILACMPDLPVPSTVVRGYELPAWVGTRTLVVAASYSGETEETLSCVAEALSRGCRPVCVTSGGRLSSLAAEQQLPLIAIPGGQQPRASLGYLSAPLLAVLETSGLCAAVETDLDETVRLLRAGVTELAPEAGLTAEPAKALAGTLHGRQAVVYGAGLTAPAARRWKGQINENAKAPSFWNELPELDHNELMGWTSLPEVTAKTVAVFLDDAHGDDRLLRRADLTAAEIERLGATVARVQARGSSRLARLFSLVQLGDYVSFYLALLYGVDPTPVKAIQDFKARLAASGG